MTEFQFEDKKMQAEMLRLLRVAAGEESPKRMDLKSLSLDERRQAQKLAMRYFSLEEVVSGMAEKEGLTVDEYVEGRLKHTGEAKQGPYKPDVFERMKKAEEE